MSALSDMQQSNHALAISLEAFTQDEIETLVTAVLDQEPNPKRLARVIWEITAGWPLYAEQVTHTADLESWKENSVSQSASSIMNVQI